MTYPNLEIFGVYDRGVPNSERVVLRSNSHVDLSQFFIFLGVKVPLRSDMVFPIPDEFLWLGRGIIDPNTWVFVYTGRGEPGITTEITTKEPVKSLYWNKNSVVLDNVEVVPVLSNFGSFLIGNKPNRSTVELKKPAVPLIDAELLKILQGMLPTPKVD